MLTNEIINVAETPEGSGQAGSVAGNLAVNHAGNLEGAAGVGATVAGPISYARRGFRRRGLRTNVLEFSRRGLFSAAGLRAEGFADSSSLSLAPVSPVTGVEASGNKEVGAGKLVEKPAAKGRKESDARKQAGPEWAALVKTLDAKAPEWSSAVRTIVEVGQRIVITAAITIDGVTREGVGCAVSVPGDGSREALEKAEQDALRCAALKFPVAREVSRSTASRSRKSTSDGTHTFPINPLAKSMSELATPKQISMIKGLCLDLGRNIEIELESALRLDCRVEEISRKAALSFIEYLKRLQEIEEIKIIRRSY